MAKFKRITSKYMCLISAVVMFFSALFYPFESFRANPSLSYISSGTHQYTAYGTYNSFDYTSANTNLPVNIVSSYVDNGILSETITTYQFTRVFGSQHFCTSTSDTYAVKIRISPVNHYVNGGQMYSYGFMFGAQDCFSDLSGSLIYYNGFQYFDHWYITDFKAESIMFSIFGNFYSERHESSEGYYINYPSFAYDLTYNISYYLYSIEDLNDEIYSTLKDIYSTNQSMLSKLEQIYTSVDTVETKLQSLVNIAEQIENNTDELEGLLKTCNSYLASIQLELEEQTTWLERIWNTLVEFFDTSNSQQDKVDDFANNSSQQSGSLDNLVDDMGQLEKPSVDSAVTDIDKVIPNGVGFVFDFLRTVTDFSVVDDMMLLSVTMAFVAYVLFGKR